MTGSAAQHEADRIAVRESVDAAQQRLEHWIGRRAARATGVRTVLEELAIDAMHLQNAPTPLRTPRAAVERQAVKR